MDVHLSLHGRQQLASQIYRQLRAGIVDGRLRPGERLPSTRDLAIRLGVSRKTTLDVFERLISEGYLHTRAGDGTFVAHAMTRAKVRRATAPLAASAQFTSRWETVADAFPVSRDTAPPRHDFLGGVTDKTSFPFDHWRRCVNHALRLQARGHGRYRDPGGEEELRVAVSRYLALSRAVSSGWEEILITHGAQQAVDLLSRILIRPGDVVALEDPGYPPARNAFAANGARLVHVPVDAEGIIVDALPDEARLVYVTPAHQFPLGMPMSLSRRMQLLEWACRRQALIVEDDYDSEFRFDGRPMESLKSLDSTGVVAYVGTFSKTIFPELRIGYAVPPPALYHAMRKAKLASDWHSCTMTQAALAKFMLDGYFAKHLRRMHKTYAIRRHALLQHLHGNLGRWMTPLPASAGLHLVALLKAPLREAEVVALAERASIGLYGTAAMYGALAPAPGLLFGYGGIDVAGIHASLTQLTQLLSTIVH